MGKKGCKRGVITRVDITCVRCGKVFQVRSYKEKSARYCSVACFHPCDTSATCLKCGKVFHVRPSKAATAKYCSVDCTRVERQSAVCIRCGKTYVVGFGSRGRYCSNACKRDRIAKVCLGCGKTFEVRKGHADDYVFCSALCRDTTRKSSTTNDLRSPNGKSYASAVERTCETCHKVYTVNAARAGSSRYCSYECRNNKGRATIVCAYCGKQKTLPKYRVESDKTRCCSIRCATLLRMKEQGFEPGYIREKRRTQRRTDIEAMAEIVLQEFGIYYLFEHKVGRYSVDFILPGLGIALECDGWQHSRPVNVARDIVRNAYLQDRGWIVIHVMDRAIRTDARSAIIQALFP